MINLEKKISLYAVLLIVFMGILSTIFFGSSVRHVLLKGERLGAFGEVLLSIAGFPALVLRLPDRFRNRIPLISKDSRFANIDGFKKNGVIQQGAKEDDGYLLLTSYNPNKRQATVKLIQIAKQKVIHEWVPDFDKLANKSDKILSSNFLPVHPILSNDVGGG